MFCVNCGSKIPDDSQFCIQCGTPVQSVSSQPVPTPAQPMAAPVQQPSVPIQPPASTPAQPVPTPAQPAGAPMPAQQAFAPAPAQTAAAPMPAQPADTPMAAQTAPAYAQFQPAQPAPVPAGSPRPKNSKTKIVVGAAAAAEAEAAAAAAEPIAVVVNGQPVTEQAVTDYIANFRTEMGLEDAAAWNDWMAQNGFTPETVRAEVIDGFVLEQLTALAAQELNIEVTQDDINQALAESRAMFESDAEYQEALAAAGMTEEEYIQNDLTPVILQDKVASAALGGASDEDGSAFNAWLDSYKQQKGVQINPMPEGLPYAL